MISETHFTNKSYFDIPKYKFYSTNHPDGTAHAGSAVLVKSNIKHYSMQSYCLDKIQATNIVIEDCTGPLVISALYCPPKHNFKKGDYVAYFTTLGSRFIAGGDYNAKHTDWGSRITSPKGRQLLSACQELKLSTVSSGKPTYWPSDTKRFPDLVDFCVTKGIADTYISAESCLELSSDHSPVIIILKKEVIRTQKPCRLHSHKTNWSLFRSLVSSTLNRNLQLKTDEDIILAVEHFNNCIQTSAWEATPAQIEFVPNSCPQTIRDKISEKRSARKQWQRSRHPKDKKRLNYITANLKKLLTEHKNLSVEKYLINLDATPATDYSLWKATKRLKQPKLYQPPLRNPDNSWANSEPEKVKTFATHLSDVFKPNVQEGSIDASSCTTKVLRETYQLDPPINKLTKTEVCSAIRKLDLHKAPGYDLITAKILRELPDEGAVVLTQIYNAILRRNYVPPQWKVAEIIMILKPGKSAEDPKSYRPISLLPITSKVLEILFLNRLNPILKDKKLIPNHQFGFRKNHGTIEQIHRLVDAVNDCYENKKYCSAAFLDISQAFDRVWHEGLLSKVKRMLPINYFLFIKSYLDTRRFFVKHGEATSNLQEIHAGVPQGSVLGPTLYLVFTADLPMTDGVKVCTYADDTAILAVNVDASKASALLQISLDNISSWLNKWRIKVNETKSVHVTYTLRKETCPPVALNNINIPQAEEAKYLGLYLDRRLTWRKHIFNKRKALGMQLRKYYWLLNRNSNLSLENKLLIYKCILKPTWTYGIQLWGTAANSNLEILQRFQSKLLRIIADAPWYITNERLHHDLKITTIKDEIKSRMPKYKDRLVNHTNELASDLLKQRVIFSRLKRITPLDLC